MVRMKIAIRAKSLLRSSKAWETSDSTLYALPGLFPEYSPVLKRCRDCSGVSGRLGFKREARAI